MTPAAKTTDSDRSLRILIVSHDFPPLNSSASRRPFSWARAWTDLGHDVHVLTTAKYRHDRLTDGGQDMSGFTVHSVAYLPGVVPVAGVAPRAGSDALPVAAPQGSGVWFDGLRRLTRRMRLGLGLFTEKTSLAYFPMRRAGAALLAGRRFDLVVSTSGPDVCPLVAGALASRFKIFWVSDYRDLWFDEFAVNRYAFTTWCVHRLQSRLLKQADLVSTVSEGLASYLEPLAPGKVTVCYNGFLEPVPTPGARVRRSGCIVYTGTFYPGKRDPRMFFEGLRILLARRPSLGGVLKVGLFGPAEEWVREQVHANDLESIVELHGSVAYAASIDAQRDAAMLLFIDWMDDRAEGVLTGKLFEYLASGVPILCVGSRADTEAARMIGSCRAGLVAVSAEDVASRLESWLDGQWSDVTNAQLVLGFSRRAQAVNLLRAARTRIAVGNSPAGRRL